MKNPLATRTVYLTALKRKVFKKDKQLEVRAEYLKTSELESFIKNSLGSISGNKMTGESADTESESNKSTGIGIIESNIVHTRPAKWISLDATPATNMQGYAIVQLVFDEVSLR